MVGSTKTVIPVLTFDFALSLLAACEKILLLFLSIFGSNILASEIIMIMIRVEIETSQKYSNVSNIFASYFCK